ncbi:tRNA (N6-isopentenyl adenosine(37)-C2)-methylthiotransferase MiaB, partial [Anoxybacillus sp. LAT_38]|nr:tRNA (N6-isopentenyl adenosine(37)-C2)-methylthiotransferase MiaB [Anoxybacillus sp. LAT_38]
SPKTTADYAKYFQPPSLKDAKKRGKEEVQVHYDFAIPDDMKGIGKGKRYYVRTYGCQMNEHDSETIAGILQQMGYSPAEEAEEADVVLFNTCAIRENAEDKVFGELGNMKRVKNNNPNLILGVCGCMS